LARIELFLPTLLSMLVIGGLSEEVGWRGFALPHLRRDHGPLVSSLVLGLLWGFWHLPAYTLPALGSALSPGQFLTFALTTPVVTVLFTWLAENSRGNLAAAVIFHASLNTASQWPSALGLATPGFGKLQSLLMLAWALLVVALPRPWGWRARQRDE
jgi:uncharacterized protein